MDDIIFNLSIFSLFLCLAIIGLILLLSIGLGRKKLLILWFFFIIALSGFAYFAEPSPSDDLYRYYLNINRLRNGIPNVQFVESPLILQKIWFFLIAQTNNNGWLPATAVLFFGFFVGSIANDYMKKNNVATRIIILYFLSCLGCCSVFSLISGVRNVIAFALWYWTYYFFYEKKKIVFYILTLVAALLHTAVVICLILSLIYHYYLKMKAGKDFVKVVIIIVLIAYVLPSPLIGNILARIPNSYANLMSQKWNYYFQYEGIMGDMGSLFVRLIVLFFTGSAIYLIVRKRGEITFSEFILSIGIPMSFSNIIFERFIILIGLVSLPTLNNTYQIMSKRIRFFYHGATLILLSIRILLSFYSMFVYMRFNGQALGGFLQSIFRG